MGQTWDLTTVVLSKTEVLNAFSASFPLCLWGFLPAPVTPHLEYYIQFWTFLMGKIPINQDEFKGGTLSWPGARVLALWWDTEGVGLVQPEQKPLERPNVRTYGVVFCTRRCWSIKILVRKVLKSTIYNTIY